MRHSTNISVLLAKSLVMACVFMGLTAVGLQAVSFLDKNPTDQAQIKPLIDIKEINLEATLSKNETHQLKVVV